MGRWWDRHNYSTRSVPKHIQGEPEALKWITDWFIANGYSEPTRSTKPKKRKIQKGMIYFLQLGNADGYVKIGFTTSLDTRLSHLMTSHPYPAKYVLTFPGTVEQEKALHEQWKNFRIRGEWFFPAVLDFVSQPD